MQIIFKLYLTTWFSRLYNYFVATILERLELPTRDTWKVDNGTSGEFLMSILVISKSQQVYEEWRCAHWASQGNQDNSNHVLGTTFSTFYLCLCVSFELQITNLIGRSWKNCNFNSEAWGFLEGFGWYLLRNMSKKQ